MGMSDRKKQGKLYGVGVGAGDPEDVTCKAVRVLEQCHVIGLQESRTAYEIARQACPVIAKKEQLLLLLPMSREEQTLKQAWREAAGQIMEKLEEGKDVALPVLGDPTIYAAVGYLKEELDKEGYETIFINGIPSFVRAAADAGITLVQGKEPLHILPGICEAEELLQLSGTHVYMKAGRKLPVLRQRLEQMAQGESEVYCVEKAGWKDKSLQTGQNALSEEHGYYTLVIVKQKN